MPLHQFVYSLNLYCVSDSVQHHYDNHCISFGANVVAVIIEFVTAVASVCVCVWMYIHVCLYVSVCLIFIYFCSYWGFFLFCLFLACLFWEGERGFLCVCAYTVFGTKVCVDTFVSYCFWIYFVVLCYLSILLLSFVCF